jgi:prolyl-tRNA synthetase
VLAPGGERVTPIMGCYGIGVERALAAVVETHHDDAGIVWPESVAPFHVAIAQLGSAAPVRDVALELYEALRAKGVEVILDDRDERPGVKFSDIELVGIPYRVTVSARGVAAGAFELTTRATRATENLPAAEIIARF